MPSRFPRRRFSALFLLLLPTFQVFSSWCGKSSSSSTSEYWLESREREDLCEAPTRDGRPALPPKPRRPAAAALTPAASPACLSSSSFSLQRGPPQHPPPTPEESTGKLNSVVRSSTEEPGQRGRCQPILFVQFRSGNVSTRRTASFQIIQTKHILKLWEIH